MTRKSFLLYIAPPFLLLFTFLLCLFYSTRVCWFCVPDLRTVSERALCVHGLMTDSTKEEGGYGVNTLLFDLLPLDATLPFYPATLSLAAFKSSEAGFFNPATLFLYL